MNREHLYVGVRGNVVAYEKSTGLQVWATPLKSSGFVNLLLDGDKVFAHTSGELFAVDAQTGKLLWRDGLTGYGYNVASLVTQSSVANAQTVLAHHLMQQEQRDSSAASTSTAD
jgi:outer membrane protein assembly factor BamB